jgi:hypothetical protein
MDEIPRKSKAKAGRGSEVQTGARRRPACTCCRHRCFEELRWTPPPSPPLAGAAVPARETPARRPPWIKRHMHGLAAAMPEASSDGLSSFCVMPLHCSLTLSCSSMCSPGPRSLCVMACCLCSLLPRVSLTALFTSELRSRDCVRARCVFILLRDPEEHLLAYLVDPMLIPLLSFWIPRPGTVAGRSHNFFCWPAQSGSFGNPWFGPGCHASPRSQKK